MLVKMLEGRVGERFSNEPGDIVEIEDAEASRLIANGSAEPAEAPKPENAALRTATTKRKQSIEDR